MHLYRGIGTSQINIVKGGDSFFIHNDYTQLLTSIKQNYLENSRSSNQKIRTKQKFFVFFSASVITRVFKVFCKRCRKTKRATNSRSPISDSQFNCPRKTLQRWHVNEETRIEFSHVHFSGPFSDTVSGYC